MASNLNFKNYKYNIDLIFLFPIFVWPSADEWPNKPRSKQATLHRELAVTKLDLLSLEPEQHWHSVIHSSHHDLAYHITCTRMHSNSNRGSMWWFLQPRTHKLLITYCIPLNHSHAHRFVFLPTHIWTL